ncbi:hypothetical protein Dimus_025012 [Dionaea muscipula]
MASGEGKRYVVSVVARMAMAGVVVWRLAMNVREGGGGCQGVSRCRASLPSSSCGRRWRDGRLCSADDTRAADGGRRLLARGRRGGQRWVAESRVVSSSVWVVIDDGRGIDGDGTRLANDGSVVDDGDRFLDDAKTFGYGGWGW